MSDARSRKDDLEAQFDWPRAIRDARRKRKLTRPEIAHRSGLSLSAVKAYETGVRHPSREALQAIIAALGLTKDEAGPILIGAGYAANWRAIFHDAYGPWPVEWFTDQVEQEAWPVFVTNEASDIIAANRLFRSLIGMPPRDRLPMPEKWNLLGLATDQAWADRVDNWDEAVSFVLGLGKTGLQSQVNLERPATWVTEAYKRVLRGDPAYLARMLQLWEPAEPVEHTTRMRYSARWRHTTGEVLRFSGLIHIADVWQVYAWHDWIPENAETLAAIDELR
jgi:transcriptional regulator with XRE-family HTH domain